MCDVEMEFAADICSGSNGQLMLKLLQVRPVGEFSDVSTTSYEKVEEEMSSVILKSGKALGAGYFEGMNYIIHVPSVTFDSARTREIAAPADEPSQ